MKTQTQTKKNTLNNQTQLAKLKKRIVDGHKTTEQIIKSTKDKARQALEEAILVGHALIEAKKLIPYGGFQKWIEKEVKTISIKTAQRYIRLAQETSGLTHQSITNLHKAYIMLGIIDDPTGEVETSGAAVSAPVESSVAESRHVVTSPVQPQPRKVITTPISPINKEDHLSRAKYLANELTNELNSKIISKLIVKEDARKIVEPLITLTA